MYECERTEPKALSAMTALRFYVVPRVGKGSENRRFSDD